MASAYPHHPGGLQQPGIPHGHPMGPGPGPNPGQPMGQPMQMHPGVSGPNGPHVSQAGPMMGMQPGMGPGPSAHALSHLTPQAHMYQQQQQQMCKYPLKLPNLPRKLILVYNSCTEPSSCYAGPATPSYAATAAAAPAAAHDATTAEWDDGFSPWRKPRDDSLADGCDASCKPPAAGESAAAHSPATYSEPSNAAAAACTATGSATGPAAAAHGATSHCHAACCFPAK